MKKLFIDMDGVLCDFIGEVEWRTGGKWDGDNIDLVSGIGLSLEGIMTRWPMLFHDLPMTSYAPQILEAASGWDTYIITDCCGDHRIAHGKVGWMNKRLPHFLDRLIFCRDKRELIGYNDSILIDDMDRHNPDFLIPQPWNANRDEDRDEYISYMSASLDSMMGSIE